MKLNAEIERSIQRDLSRPHDPSRAFVWMTGAICSLLFIYGIYLVIANHKIYMGLWFSTTSVLFYSRILMGFRYWSLINWTKMRMEKNSE